MTTGSHIAPDIHFLRHGEIDAGRWDRCILHSHSPVIYGRSFYLDAMAAGRWEALVMGDYEAVMPLTWRSKYGIRYLYQPAFVQQTGIFSLQPTTASLIDVFLRELDRHFRFAEIYLNFTNAHSMLDPRTNFILPLDGPYDLLAGRYKKDLVRNLKLAQRTPLTYITDFDLQTALRDFRSVYAAQLPAIKAEDYRRFGSLCIFLQQQGQLLTRAVLDQGGSPLCSAVFLRDSRRFYLLHSTTLPAGRDFEANHFLLDRFIREWAGSGMILDFEGSDHPGIAHFYANFGGVDQPYFFYRRNRLPGVIRWMK
ncbi:MAG TPA: GNAT family N-acetyltransferase [Puia sp.]|nr:GNAT family N-acetyltransferase [Puia sp.]